METGIKAAVVGTAPPPDELEEVVWARQTIADSGKTLVESLRQLVTLSAAVLAGTAALFGKVPCPVGFQACASVCFIAALACSLWGAVPRKEPLDHAYPLRVRKTRERINAHRRGAVIFSASFLFGGFTLLVAGLVIGLFVP